MASSKARGGKPTGAFARLKEAPKYLIWGYALVGAGLLLFTGHCTGWFYSNLLTDITHKLELFFGDLAFLFGLLLVWTGALLIIEGPFIGTLKKQLGGGLLFVSLLVLAALARGLSELTAQELAGWAGFHLASAMRELLTWAGAFVVSLIGLVGALLLITEGQLFHQLGAAWRALSEGQSTLRQTVSERASGARPPSAEPRVRSRSRLRAESEPATPSEVKGLREAEADLEQALKALEEDEPVPAPEIVASEAKRKEREYKPVLGADQGETLGASKAAAVMRSQRIKLPPLALLNLDDPESGRKSQEHARKGVALLERAFSDFGVDAKVVHHVVGPTVTRYEVEPAPGVRVSRISQLDDDIQRILEAVGVRIEAPVPGTSIVGVEVGNQKAATVSLGSVMNTPEFKRSAARYPLTCAFGRDVAGTPIVGNLAEMPHLLVGGTTYSGKSVCLNAIILSLVMNNTPDQVQLVLVDPKRVELTLYQGMPHLYAPVISSPKAAVAVLQQVMREMDRRNMLFHKLRVRNIGEYNELTSRGDAGDYENLPYIVVIIDELADLMATAPGEFEPTVCRLAQLARASGIHLVLATQRPSAQTVTGAIKANISARIAFRVAQQIESRIILDVNGAERLRGHGDMLYYDGRTYPIRGQGSLVTSAEIQKVLNYLKDQLTPSYSFEPAEESEQEVSGQRAADDILEDDKFEAALRLVLERQEASVSIIQRNFGVGWSRAGRLMDMMYRLGIVGPYEGSKPRQILVDPAEYLALLAQGGIDALRKRKPDQEPKPQLPLDEGEPDDATSEEE